MSSISRRLPVASRLVLVALLLPLASLRAQVAGTDSEPPKPTAATQVVSSPEPEPKAEEIEAFRAELAQFFTDITQYSPTVLGDLAENPRAQAEVQKAIEELPAEELALLRAGFARSSEWRFAAEALRSSIPEEIRRLPEASRRKLYDAEQTEAFRHQTSTILAITQMLPEATLEANLGQSRLGIAALHQGVHGLPAERLAAMRAQVEERPEWSSVKQDLYATIPPQILDAGNALARRGPLDEEATEDLEAFREGLEDFFEVVAELPDELRREVDVSALDRLSGRLGTLTPEMLFVVRRELDTPALHAAVDQARLLVSAGSIDAEDRAELERFRVEAGGLYEELATVSGAEGYRVVSDRVGEMEAANLVLMRDRMERIPEWRATVPIVVGALSSEATRETLAAVESGTLSAAETASLEGFRGALVADLAAVQTASEGEAEAVGRAIESVASASPGRLAVMQAARAQISADDDSSLLAPVTSAIAHVSANCSIGLPSFSIPSIDFGSVDLLFGSVDLGSWDFPNVSLPDLNLNPVCDVIFAPINAVIDGLNVTIAFVTDAFNAISGVIDSVLSFVETIPDLLADGLTSFFDFLLDAVGLNISDLTNPAKWLEWLDLGAGFAGQVGSFLQGLDLPDIPCPPVGFDVPLFGEVGESDTADKYNLFLWILDKVIGLIPDTEPSLPIKVGATTALAGVEYMGICLDLAAGNEDERIRDEYRDEVRATFVSNTSSINANIDMAEANVSTALTNATTNVNADLDALSAQFAAQIQVFDDQLSNFERLQVQLKIEKTLLEPGHNVVALFQLPVALGGQLERVRVIVATTIDEMVGAGENVSSAPFYLLIGDNAYGRGEYKAAYRRYRRAYLDAVGLP